MKKEKKKGSCLKTILLIFAVFIVLGIIGSVFGGTDEKTTEDDAEILEQTENKLAENDEPEETNEVEPDTSLPETSSDPAEESEKIYSSLSEIELDELQQLYLDFDSSLSYSDAIDCIIATGLPYSEEKYNGSRTIQVAFTEECTAQKYMKESGDYLTITYRYPKDENSINDELDKYTFGTCGYFPANSSLQLIEHKVGYYFSIYEPGNYILGTKEEIDTSITKDDQMLFYYNNK